MTVKKILAWFLIFTGVLLLVGIAVWLSIGRRSPKKQTKKHALTGESGDRIDVSKYQATGARFAITPPVYFQIVGNIVAPTNACCGAALTIEKATDANESFYLLLNKTDYLTLTHTTLNDGTFYSTQALRNNRPTEPWKIQKTGENTFRFYQTTKDGNMFLGLSSNQKSIIGLSPEMPHATLDVVLGSIS